MTHIRTYQRPVTDIIPVEHFDVLQSTYQTNKTEDEATEEARGGTSNIWDESDYQHHSSLFDNDE